MSDKPVNVFCSEKDSKEPLEKAFERVIKYVIKVESPPNLFVFCENSDEKIHVDFLNELKSMRDNNNFYVIFISMTEPEIKETGNLLKDILKENWAEYRLGKNANIIKIIKTLICGSKNEIKNRKCF